MRSTYLSGKPDSGLGPRIFGLLLAGALLGGCGSMHGCGSRRQQTEAPPQGGNQQPGGSRPEAAEASPVLNDPPPLSESQEVDLHVYLDSSGSMQYFLTDKPKAGQKNYFASVVKDAGNTLCVDWSGECSLWRFGSGEPRELTGNDIYAFTNRSAFKDQTTHI